MKSKFKGIVSGLLIASMGLTLGACAPKEEEKKENKMEQNKKNEEKKKEESSRNVDNILNMIKL